MKKWLLLPGLVFPLFILPAHALSLGSDNNPDRICLVPDANTAAKSCKNGQMLIFQPQVFGNEQFPVLIAGLFCDYRSPIVHSVGAVSCVFSDARKKDWPKLLGGQ